MGLYFTMASTLIVYEAQNDWHLIFSNDEKHAARYAGIWVLKLLMGPNMCVFAVTNFMFREHVAARLFCGGLSTALHNCAERAQAVGNFLDRQQARFILSPDELAQMLLCDPSAAATEQQRRSEPSAIIMDQVGGALDGSDSFTLIIPPDFIEIEPEAIAAGGFAQIHRGTFAGKQVAVKKIYSQMIDGGLDEIRHEVRILNNLRGMPHVILLHGVSMQSYNEQQVLLVVLDWCPLSLADLVRQPRKKPEAMSAAAVDPATFLAVAKQLVNALRVLHHKSYVHLDLKPENILFAQSDDLKASLRICDFGSSRMTGSEGSCPAPKSLAGISPLYAPPEAIDAKALAAALKSDQSRREEGSRVPPAARGGTGEHAERDDDKSFDGRAFDLYSLGILLWVVWHQSTPELSTLLSPDFSRDAAFFAVPAENWTLEVLRRTLLGWRPDPHRGTGPLGSMPAEAAALLVALGSDSPAARPSAAAVMEALTGAVGQAVAAVRSPSVAVCAGSLEHPLLDNAGRSARRLSGDDISAVGCGSLTRPSLQNKDSEMTRPLLERPELQVSNMMSLGDSGNSKEPWLEPIA